MKKILLFICSVVISVSLSAQSWVMQNSGFTDTATFPNAIKIIDANHVWLFGNSTAGPFEKEVSTTGDGGAHWTIYAVNNNPDWGIITGTATTADSAWALLFDFNNGGGKILATANGGVSWSQQDSGVAFMGGSSFPDFIHFWNSQEGIAMGDPYKKYYEIYHTVNGGANWTRIDSANIPAPAPGEAGLVNDFAVIGDNVWFGAFYDRVYHSTDHGLTWTVSAINDSASVAGPIAFRDALHGLAIITLVPDHVIGGLYSTSDGGASWTPVNYTGSIGISDIVAIPGTSEYVSCASYGPSSGFSSYSSDDGQTWTLIDTTGNGTTNGYAKLAFADAQTGWAGGFNQSPTLDGVYRWNALSTNIKKLAADSDVKIYPNPVKNNFTIDINSKLNVEKWKLEIYNVRGEKIYGEILSKKQEIINTKNFSSGIYFIRVNYGEEIYTQKIVVEK